jgi:MFS family permease
MATTTTPATDRRRHGPGGPKALLAVLSGNMLLDALEVSTIFVALPRAAGRFGLAPSAAHWLQSGFAVGFGCFVLYGGRLTAMVGKRRAYVAALVAFAAASLVSAVATTAALVIAARVLKGAAVALTAPTGLAVICELFPDGPERQRALRLYAACGACGLSAGAVVSGVLTGAGWRYALAFPVPVALALGWLAARVLPPEALTVGTAPPRRPPWSSLASLPVAVAGTSLLVAATGGDPGSRLWTGLSGICLLALLVRRWERGAARVAIDLLRRPSFRLSVCGAAALNGSFWGLLFVLSLTTQRAGHWPPIAAATLVLVAGGMTLALTLRAAGLQARFGADRLIGAGWVLTATGYAACLLPPVNLLDPVALILVMLATGTGFGLSFGALHSQAMRAMPSAVRGSAAAGYQTAVQLGGALVLAATAALVPGIPTPQLPRAALWFLIGCAAFGLTVSLTDRGARSRSVNPR